MHRMTFLAKRHFIHDTTPGIEVRSGEVVRNNRRTFPVCRAFFPSDRLDWDRRSDRESMELEELLQRCRKGEDLAWESLVRLYQGRIFGLCLHYVDNADDARDVAQNVFVKVYRNLRRCPGAEHFLPWILTICRNACLDHLRRRRARPTTTDLANVRFVQGRERNPEEQALADSRKGLLYRALARLTRMNREIVLLKEIQGLSLEEIARLLKIPLGTAKSRSHRARLELADHLLQLSDMEGRLESDG